MISTIAFILILAAVFVPRILQSRQDIPQFTLDVVSSPGHTTIEVAGATMPQPASAYLLEVFRNGTLLANASLPAGDPSLGMGYNDANGNGLLDRGDSISLNTEPGHGYLVFLYYKALSTRVGKADWQT